MNFNDFLATLLTMQGLKGFAYFNSGIESGASVPHKHMQVIPYKSITNASLPIMNLDLTFTLDKGITSGPFTLPIYKTFPH